MLPHDELLHYGRKGMRWGVHNAVSKVTGGIAKENQKNADMFKGYANATSADSKKSLAKSNSTKNPILKGAHKLDSKVYKFHSESYKIEAKKSQAGADRYDKLSKSQAEKARKIETVSKRPMKDVYSSSNRSRNTKSYNTAVAAIGIAAATSMAAALAKPVGSMLGKHLAGYAEQKIFG